MTKGEEFDAKTLPILGRNLENNSRSRKFRNLTRSPPHGRAWKMHLTRLCPRQEEAPRDEACTAPGGDAWCPWKASGYTALQQHMETLARRDSDGETRLCDSSALHASEQLLLSSASKSGRQVTMAKTAPVRCEASPSLAGGTGPSAKPGRLHVAGAAAAQRPLRRPCHRDAQRRLRAKAAT